ncbi:MAG: hypothetical protein HYY06_05470 [Deltaproteobacteria bacterium]|nr:hypothetical protein [Deltaproteobacteria bacterium]
MAMGLEHSGSNDRARRATPGSARSGPVAILIASWLCACAAQVGADPPPAGTISGTITYDGPAAGGGRPIAVAVYRNFPPSGPPVSWKLLETYELPVRYSFDGLPPGNYWVGAAIDVDPADTRYVGMLNPRRDPHGYALEGRRIEVGEIEGAAGADVRMEDRR